MYFIGYMIVVLFKCFYLFVRIYVFNTSSYVLMFTGVTSWGDVGQSTDETVSTGEEDCYSVDADT